MVSLIAGRDCVAGILVAQCDRHAFRKILFYRLGMGRVESSCRGIRCGRAVDGRKNCVYGMCVADVCDLFFLLCFGAAPHPYAFCPGLVAGIDFFVVGFLYDRWR